MTGPVGTPRKITDGFMNVVWDGVFDPFWNPVSGLSLSLTNLRFPGQYLDGEIALNQNWNRDYDPTTGRYIQSDPVGLDNGTNTYAYVSNKPLIEIDPQGLAECERDVHCQDLNRIDTDTCNAITKFRGKCCGRGVPSICV